MAVRDEQTQDLIAAEHHQPAPQFRLENDEQPQHHGGQQVIEDLAQFRQGEGGDDYLGDQEQADHDQPHGPDHARTARGAEEAQRGINGHGQNGDLDEVACAHRIVELPQSYIQRLASLLKKKD